MDIEEEILAFGETVVWVECDLCGRAFGGPDLNKAIVAVGHVNVCVDCLPKSPGLEAVKQVGGSCCGGAAASPL